MATDYQQYESKVIELARFILAILIVVRHSAYSEIISGGGYNSIIQVFLSHGVSSLAVPTFFLISGYLFFKKLEHWDWNVWLGKMKRRVMTLIVPYLCWNLIALGIISVQLLATGAGLNGVWDFWNQNGFVRIFWDCNQVGVSDSYNIIGQHIPGGTPIDGPLWFLRDLIVLTLLSPAIYCLCYRLGWIWICLSCALYLTRIGIPMEGFSGDGIFFFSLGAFIVQKGSDMLEFFKKAIRWNIVISALLLVAMCIVFYYDKEIFRVLRYIFTLFGVSVVLWSLIPFAKKYSDVTIKRYSSTSFFIFALHGLILYPLVKYPLDILIIGTSDVINLTRYLITIAITLALCLGSYFILKQISPRTLKFITGR